MGLTDDPCLEASVTDILQNNQKEMMLAKKEQSFKTTLIWH